MTDNDINVLAWRAFYFGLRVMAAQEGKDVSYAESAILAKVVREIAENETTLEDPTALAIQFPSMAETIQKLGTLCIRNSRAPN